MLFTFLKNNDSLKSKNFPSCKSAAKNLNKNYALFNGRTFIGKLKPFAPRQFGPWTKNGTDFDKVSSKTFGTIVLEGAENEMEDPLEIDQYFYEFPVWNYFILCIEDAFLRILEFEDFAEMKIGEHKGRCYEIGEKNLGKNYSRNAKSTSKQVDEEQKARHVQKAHSYR